MQWLGCCFFAQALFWGVIWALKRPKEQERKRMQWRRAESWDPALLFLTISLMLGALGHVKWDLALGLASPSSRGAGIPITVKGF